MMNTFTWNDFFCNNVQLTRVCTKREHDMIIVAYIYEHRALYSAELKIDTMCVEFYQTIT